MRIISIVFLTLLLACTAGADSYTTPKANRAREMLQNVGVATVCVESSSNADKASELMDQILEEINVSFSISHSSLSYRHYTAVGLCVILSKK